MLSCTLQRIYSSVATLSGSQSRKACNSGGDCVAACKPVISDFAREVAATANSNCEIWKNQKIAIILGSDNYSAVTTKLTFWSITVLEITI